MSIPDVRNQGIDPTHFFPSLPLVQQIETQSELTLMLISSYVFMNTNWNLSLSQDREYVLLTPPPQSQPQPESRPKEKGGALPFSKTSLSLPASFLSFSQQTPREAPKQPLNLAVILPTIKFLISTLDIEPRFIAQLLVLHQKLTQLKTQFEETPVVAGKVPAALEREILEISAEVQHLDEQNIPKVEVLKEGFQKILSAIKMDTPPSFSSLRQQIIAELSLSKPAAPPTLISSRVELAALVTPQPHQSLALPLTFIVPYPFERTVENPVASGAKAAKGERKRKRGEGGKEETQQAMAFIPKGPVLFQEETLDLEAFAISITPVTNNQFAFWLNERLQAKSLDIASGEIRDLAGNLLCYTREKAPLSQIQMTIHGGELLFTPLRHTENHPVVFVTWKGAVSFCKDNNLQLPTEAQWEKAAGMDLPQPEAPLKKFLYGFGKNELDKTLANYRSSFISAKVVENRTMPVGFYNGQTFFADRYETLQTQPAVSPYGCYDMSGNVREWTLEGALKGGSYDSPPEELLVTARTCLELTTADAYTGFRVVIQSV